MGALRTEESVILVEKLVKRYGDLTAVDGIDLEIHPGECFGLLGPNGAGKTTTVEILEGIQPPTSGEVRVLGRPWRRDDPSLRQRLGIALQETRLPDRLSVFEVLRLFRSFYKKGRDVEEVLREVDLADKRDAWVIKLSGGQRQKLTLACALVGDPELLFLDEPTTGLDPRSRRMVWERIERIRGQGRTLVLTTHYMEEAWQLCDRVAIMDHGRILEQGVPAELVAALGREDASLEDLFLELTGRSLREEI